MRGYLVETTNQDPELLIVHATNERGRDFGGGLVPSKVLDLGTVGELCDTFFIDISLGEGMAGRGLFGQVLGGIGDCCIGRWGRGGC